MTTAAERVAAALPNLGRPDLSAFTSWDALTPHLANEETKLTRKLASSLEDAIRRSGLKDGDTISFHHHFRGGDKIVMLVVDELARLGFKNLTLAPSSLHDAHGGLVEHIQNGVISKIYSSGVRGALAKAVSNGLMDEPITIHSHGGRVALLQTGELHIDVAFIGVSACDPLGNANGVTGRSHCGSLGYAMVDAEFADRVVMVTEEIVPYPNTPASIRQDQVDVIAVVDSVGDPKKISTGAARATSNPRELLIANLAAEVIEHCGLFEEGFSIQTGSGGASTATMRFMSERMKRKGITAGWALGGMTGAMVDLQNEGLIDTLVDTQSFDIVAADNILSGNKHHEISASEYANPFAKGTAVDMLDMVILSALEIDLNFNVNVLTGSDGIVMGASGGHCDTAAGAKLSIITGPLLRGRIPTVVEEVTTLITPGVNIGVLVTDHGIAVNPNKPDLEARLREAKLPVFSIQELYEKSVKIAGKPKPLEFGDKPVAVVRYRDGQVLDIVHEIQ